MVRLINQWWGFNPGDAGCDRGSGILPRVDDPSVGPVVLGYTQPRAATRACTRATFTGPRSVVSLMSGMTLVRVASWWI